MTSKERLSALKVNIDFKRVRCCGNCKWLDYSESELGGFGEPYCSCEKNEDIAAGGGENSVFDINDVDFGVCRNHEYKD